MTKNNGDPAAATISLILLLVPDPAESNVAITIALDEVADACHKAMEDEVSHLLYTL